MNIKLFKDNLKFNYDFIDEFVEVFINSSNISNLKMKAVFENASEFTNRNKEKNEINIEDFIYFFDKVITPDYVKNGNQRDLIVEMTKKNSLYISYNSIFNTLNTDDNYNHSLYINVSAEDTISVVNGLYKVFKYRQIEQAIIIPQYAYINGGKKNQITIKCNTKNLEYVLKAIQSINDYYKDKIKEPNQFFPTYNNIGYEYKNTSKIIGKLLLRSIVSSIKKWSLNHPEVKTEDGSSIMNELENNFDTNHLQRILRYISKRDDSIVEIIKSTFIQELEYEGLIKESHFSTDELEKELNLYYSFKEEETLKSETKYNPLEEKYLMLINDPTKLGEYIICKDGSQKKLVEVFEEYNILNNIPPSSTVYLNEGIIMSGEEFINKYLIRYLEIIGNDDLELIMDKYVSKIVKKKIKK